MASIKCKKGKELENQFSFLNTFINKKTVDFDMKKVLILLLVAVSFCLNAQSFQLGLSGGISNYSGDLSPGGERFSLGETGFAVGALARFNHNPFLGTRVHLTYGRILGDDANSSVPARQERNLSFQTDMVELAVMGEFNLIGFDPDRGKFFSPFLFAGISGYYYNPKAEYEGQLVALQPLGTEGQGIEGYAEPYSLVGFAIPFGGGIKIAFSETTTLTFEAGARKTFTDYLDDVGGDYAPYQVVLENNGELAAALSNRTDEFLGIEPIQNPTSPRSGPAQDWFFFSVATISFTLDGSGGSLFRGKNQLGCFLFS
jgi:hypothetical protein